tara:strand:- start:99 stop:575 length:477 start_codon:yes stop_codon:yes gene_type:complete
MKKKFKIILMLLISTFLFSCGYKKVVQNNEPIVYINNFNIEGGNKRLAYLIKNEILLISKENAENKIDIDIKLNKNKIGKIKDKSGKVTRYTIELGADLSFKEVNNTKLIGKSFNKSGDFDIASNHFDTLNRENTTTSNIAEEITEEISRYLILYFKN